MKKDETLSAIDEELLSSLDIQDWNLKSFAKEIYENVGQILSLAKIRIATLNPEKKEETKQIVEQSDFLLEKAIKDLRNLARQLTPTEIINKGFADSVCQELERLDRAGICATDCSTKGKPYRLEATRELILFSILHHYIYKALYKEKAGSMTLHISYGTKNINLQMKWQAGLADEPLKAENEESNRVIKRARLIQAHISTHGNETERKIFIQVKRDNS